MDIGQGDDDAIPLRNLPVGWINGGVIKGCDPDQLEWFTGKFGRDRFLKIGCKYLCGGCRRVDHGRVVGCGATYTRGQPSGSPKERSTL